jgi:pimeloyl-ACP methyl ester carboxylesterase
MGVGMPETRYARSGDVMVAYQVLGEGPFDVVYVPGAISHVELQWDAAGLATLLRGLAEHARVLVFDKRGTGMSDRVAGVPALEERSDDIRAVMDAAGSDRAALFGVSEGVPMSVVFAASHPECVTRFQFRNRLRRSRRPGAEGRTRGMADVRRRKPVAATRPAHRAEGSQAPACSGCPAAIRRPLRAR